MLNRLILKVTKFQLPPKRLGTKVKNIWGAIMPSPPPPMSNRVKHYNFIVPSLSTVCYLIHTIIQTASKLAFLQMLLKPDKLPTCTTRNRPVSIVTVVPEKLLSVGLVRKPYIYTSPAVKGFTGQTIVSL